MNNTRIAKLLKQLRIEKGLTQKEVSLIVGCSESCASMWESEKRIPSDNQKIKLANLYETTVGYLFFGE